MHAWPQAWFGARVGGAQGRRCGAPRGASGPRGQAINAVASSSHMEEGGGDAQCIKVVGRDELGGAARAACAAPRAPCGSAAAIICGLFILLRARAPPALPSTGAAACRRAWSAALPGGRAGGGRGAHRAPACACRSPPCSWLMPSCVSNTSIDLNSSLRGRATGRVEEHMGCGVDASWRLARCGGRHARQGGAVQRGSAPRASQHPKNPKP